MKNKIEGTGLIIIAIFAIFSINCILLIDCKIGMGDICLEYVIRLGNYHQGQHTNKGLDFIIVAVDAGIAHQLALQTEY